MEVRSPSARDTTGGAPSTPSTTPLTLIPMLSLVGWLLSFTFFSLCAVHKTSLRVFDFKTASLVVYSVPAFFWPWRKWLCRWVIVLLLHISQEVPFKCALLPKAGNSRYHQKHNTISPCTLGVTHSVTALREELFAYSRPADLAELTFC